MASPDVRHTGKRRYAAEEAVKGDPAAVIIIFAVHEKKRIESPHLGHTVSREHPGRGIDCTDRIDFGRTRTEHIRQQR
jgi:hypothetical protein